MDKERAISEQVNFKRLQEAESSALKSFNSYIIIMTKNSDKIHKCGVFVSVAYF